MKIFIFILFFLTNCIGYLSHLGKEQIHQIWSRQKILDIIQNRTEDDPTIQSLEFIQEIKSFGVEHVALSSDSGFEYFVKLNRKEVGWNVSASYPLEFKSYTWWFPIAGEVPYKGYFDMSLAMEEEKNLKQLGLDTRLRVTGGYSTLGWLSDPVFSPQLEWSKPDLAGLVFHEMAHATYYLPGDSTFNESYAEFVERKAVELYYKNKSDPDYLDWYDKKSKRLKSFALIIDTANQLKSIYESSHTDEVKLKQKFEIISSFKAKAIRDNYIPKKVQQKFMEKDWNNEDFIGALRYKSGGKFFEAQFQKANGNFSIFHNLVKSYESLSKEEKEKILAED
ncbi:MAG: aminopeptidase [Leptospiraceae bacterium]|nr:aminopeptidase [Leptospiraceae bacterium]